MRVLVTGGAGFIGSALVRRLLDTSGVAEVRVLDAFTYAGLPENLPAGGGGVPDGLVVRRGDVCDASAVAAAMEGCDAVFHLAAESHVDRSIVADDVFMRTNVLGTRVVLDRSLEAGVGRVLLASTDEVYGDLPIDSDGRFAEASPFAPSSPYAASKAAADLLAGAYARTHGLDVVVVRGSNTYGPRQLPEKLIPRMLRRARAGERLPVFGDGGNVRDWLHVDDHVTGMLSAHRAGRAGRSYNLGSACERSVLDVVDLVLGVTGADPALVEHVEDRKGHDRRYALDISRARAELGWQPGPPIDDRIGAVARWYEENPGWIQAATRRLGEWA